MDSSLLLVVVMCSLLKDKYASSLRRLDNFDLWKVNFVSLSFHNRDSTLHHYTCCVRRATVTKIKKTEPKGWNKQDRPWCSQMVLLSMASRLGLALAVIVLALQVCLVSDFFVVRCVKQQRSNLEKWKKQTYT